MPLSLDGTTGISASGNIVGNNISVSGTLSAGTFSPTTVSASGNVTGGNILTAGVVSATGNITGNFILGNGSQLTGVDATQIVSGTSNAKVVSSGGNIAVGIGGTANVAVFATTGAFITGVITATGNATAGNVLTAGVMSSTGNGIHGNILTGGLISATSTITSAANVTGGNIITAGLVTATGNVTGGNLLTGGLISATSTITSAANVVGGNVTTGGLMSATGNLIGSNMLTAGIMSSTGNGIHGNILTAGQISATGNITGGNVLGGANVNATTHTGTTVSVTGNVDAGNVRTAGLISATGSITTAGDLSLTGNIVDTGALGINTTSNANITLNAGTGFIIASSGILNGQANGTGNIGNSTGYFNTIFAKATSAQYADLAEMYVSGAQYEPGTVVIFGGSYEVEISTTSHANHVAGVISTNPSYIMNAGQTGPHVVPVALQGRVPTKVIGTIRKGDRMVTSDLPGVATVLDPARYEPGCIIGKALTSHEPAYDDAGNEMIGTIEVVVGRV